MADNRETEQARCSSSESENFEKIDSDEVKLHEEEVDDALIPFPVPMPAVVGLLGCRTPNVFALAHEPLLRHLLGVTVGNRTIWQSPWVNGVCAVMAGTSDKYFTMQGSGNPVSASGQGEKAGPQASSSSDCSSSVVGNLATGECTITRSNSHLCNKNSYCTDGFLQFTRN
ncbi:hypothetical protein EVAR_87290_1 [Eumeta japonica]|uniref:Uncharacterized protein n=1 Tax=Eumeta variegata TaxID=151549 RepID=A0A4C1VVV1_EUMVA|nr:hypothetical protein EVAR_87290_1 [Eumeta japonica]